MQNAENMDCATRNSIHDDVRQRGENKFPRALLLAMTPEIRKSQQSGGSFVNGTHQLWSVLWCFFEQINL